MPRKTYGTGSLYKDKRTGRWYASYYVHGKRHREATHTTDRSKAKALLEKRLREVLTDTYGEDRSVSATVSDLCEDVITDYQVNGKRSLVNLQMRLAKHILPALGKAPAQKLTTADIQRYIKDRLTAGASNATINRELAVLKRAYTLGLRAESVTRKPYIPMLQENNARKGFFEHAELEQICAHLPTWLHPALTFAYYTGWRIHSEIMPLTWSQVDLTEGTISLYAGQTKNKEARTIYLPPLLQSILASQKDRQQQDYPSCEFVFDRNGKQIKSFRFRWLEARKEAGLGDRILHDFRRTAVRNMVRAGVPERVAMSITGHKTRGVFERYNIVSTGDLQRAAQQIGQAMAPVTLSANGQQSNSAPSSSSKNPPLSP